MSRRNIRRRSSWQWPAIAAASVLVASSCGARLSPAQIRAASGNGVQAGGQSTAGDGTTGDTTTGDPSAGGGATSGGGQTGGATAGGGAVAGGATATTVAGGVAAAACKPDTSATDVGLTGNQITFGNISTVGGPVPGIFKGARDGVNAFFAYQNARGGVCGRKLTLAFQDDGFDESQNGQAYSNLIPKVLGFVGSFSTTDTEGSRILSQNGAVPDASYALSQPHFALTNNFSIQPLKPNAWRLGPMTYFKNKFGIDQVGKIAYFTENVQSAVDAGTGEKNAAKSLGYTIVYDQKTEPTDTDFNAYVKNMHDRGAQTVFMAGDAGQMAQIASTMKANDVKMNLANWGANAYDPAFVKQSGGPGGGSEGAIIDMQNAMFYGEDSAQNPEVKLFVEWVKKVGGKTDLFAAYGWASARLMVQALQTAGPKPTRANVLNALKGIHKFDANGLFPPADPAGKIPPTCYVIVNVKGGAFVRDPVNPTGFKCDPGGYL